MIDLNVIEVRCNAYLNSVGRSCSTVLDVNELKELVAYARQAEKDAARYRWLCSLKVYDQLDSIDQVFYANKVDTDTAIDEATKCNK